MKNTKKYSSKLLLFGEHIIIKGAEALAVPFPKFSGNWQYLTKESDLSKQQSLPKFANHLENNFSHVVDSQLFINELKNGLYFESNIPTGYGVGSSGALVAAVFDKFGKGKNIVDKIKLKTILAEMESFFHGSSSGTDPLICYLNEAILLKGKDSLEIVSLPNFQKKGNWTLFLLDTGIQRQTAPFVDIFLNKCETSNFDKLIQSDFFPINSKAIKSFLNGNWSDLFEFWHQISDFQYHHFQEMITHDFMNIWKNGLKNSSFKLKLCGAGGGGFILGITNNFQITQQKLKNYQLLKI